MRYIVVAARRESATETCDTYYVARTDAVIHFDETSPVVGTAVLGQTETYAAAKSMVDGLNLQFPEE